jgi:hypothetical protein
MQGIQFKKVFTPAGVPDSVGVVSIEEIQKMTMAEFLSFEGQLMNVRRRKRRDLAIFEGNTAITPAHAKQVFRKGVGDEDTPATSNVSFVKTRAHTNMNRGGSFGEGSLTVITAIEAYIALTAMKATTYTNGIVTNPLGVAPANYDPALLLKTIAQQFEVGFYRGETLIIDGLVEEFPQVNGFSGFAGASPGALVQNALLPNNYLNNPQSLKDDEDFHVQITPLAALDLTTATGLNVPFNVGVKLSTIEVRRVYA